MIITTLFKKVDVELHVIAMLAQAQEMSNAAHGLLMFLHKAKAQGINRSLTLPG